jgi:hypothetical protein
MHGHGDGSRAGREGWQREGYGERGCVPRGGELLLRVGRTVHLRGGKCLSEGGSEGGREGLREGVSE